MGVWARVRPCSRIQAPHADWTASPGTPGPPQQPNLGGTYLPWGLTVPVLNDDLLQTHAARIVCFRTCVSL